MQLYPKGKDTGLPQYLSLYLALVDSETLNPCSNIYTQIILRILDQKQSKHQVGKGKVACFPLKKLQDFRHAMLLVVISVENFLYYQCYGDVTYYLTNVLEKPKFNQNKSFGKH